MKTKHLPPRPEPIGAVDALIAKGLVVTGPKVGTRVLQSDQWNWFDPDVVAWQSKAGLTREFLRDLQVIERSLASHHAQALVGPRLAPLKRAVQVFGFHLATLDIRQSSDQHEAVVAELLRAHRRELLARARQLGRRLHHCDSRGRPAEHAQCFGLNGHNAGAVGGLAHVEHAAESADDELSGRHGGAPLPLS